jgi:hypothetical protein
MRKTIARGVLLATAGLALIGFGMGQASAAIGPLPPVQFTPAVPDVPALPAASALPGGLGNVANVASAALPSDTITTDRSDLPGAMDVLPEHAAVGGVVDSVAPLDTDLPLQQIGVPARVDAGKLPPPPETPALAKEVGKAPVAQLPATDKLPVVAQVDHNNLAHLVPNTDGVEISGMPKTSMPAMGSAVDVVQPVTSTPQTAGMESAGLPQQLPVVSDVDTTMPGVEDVTGSLDMPTQWPVA